MEESMIAVPPGKKSISASDGGPPLMDRSCILRTSFMRPANDKGQTPCELVGRAYRDDLYNLLKTAAHRGLKWENRLAKWPEQQIDEQMKDFKDIIEYEVTDEEYERIEYYLTYDIRDGDVEQLPEPLWQRVLDKTDTKFKQDPRLRGLFEWLHGCAKLDWDRGSREALLREALLDPWQQQRLQVRSLPPPFPRVVITSPAPWSRDFHAAKQFCKSSLMAASSVVLSGHPIWERKLGNKFEILPVNEMNSNRPFYLKNLDEKITDNLNNARQQILNYLFLCAEHMWVRQKKWDFMVCKDKGASEDMIRLLNCLSSLTSRRLREKTLDARQAWSQVVLSITASTEERPVKPLIKFRLDESTKKVRDDVERAKELITSTYLKIFEVTRTLPSVGTLMFKTPK